jgi:hypothetical protein
MLLTKLRKPLKAKTNQPALEENGELLHYSSAVR